ncbi:MAG: cobyrinate a,c-diamide synthase [Clostridia bacterium]|nr:cobyrinate a,c-diamide synthase [Clostridia bacterium]
MISGTGSGCGKTTIMSAVLRGLVEKGLSVQPYKCGPDYIDPMFHSFIANRKSKNLDSYMCDENTVKYLMADSFENADVAVVEGVMGFYDGVDKTDKASSYDIARITDTPVILVVNAKGMSLSLAAMVGGFVNFRDKINIAAVILNNISSGMYSFYKQLLSNIGIETIGYLPNIKQAQIESRHLGLHTAAEIDDLDEKVKLLADTACQTIDFERLLEIANNAPPILYEAPIFAPKGSFKLGVAYDRAFCFYYEDNLRLMEKFGAQIVYFSPIDDKKLPDDLDGLYLGGGYPENYLKALSENKQFIFSMKSAIIKKIPVYAECGGFMYLLEAICDCAGKRYETAGVLNGEARLGNKLCRFGYIELKSKTDNLLLQKDDKIRGHEFHYSDSTANGNDFYIQRPNGKWWYGVNARDNIFAGYPHLHFYSNTKAAENFAKKCLLYKESRCGV